MFLKISAPKKFCNIHRKTPVLKVAPGDIAKIEISNIFVLFENEVLYKDFFYPQMF